MKTKRARSFFRQARRAYGKSGKFYAKQGFRKLIEGEGGTVSSVGIRLDRFGDSGKRGGEQAGKRPKKLGIEIIDENKFIEMLPKQLKFGRGRCYNII